MSLITRCPACATQFKVVPDQLKLSAGWVRCGHCSDVFDATRYLENWVAGAAEAERSGESAVPPASRPDEPSPTPQLLSKTVAPSATSVAPGAPQQGDLGSDETADFHAELQRFAKGLPSKSVVDSQAAMPELAVPAPVVFSAPAPQAPTALQAVDRVAEQPADSPLPAALEPDFMRQGRRRAFWRSPGVRALLSLVALLLSAVLAAQWALQERDRLAASHPAWKPLLASLCEPLGCAIGAVRDLQAVVIESSTLTRRIGDFYSFDLVLKNNAAIPLAVPALELSLTDTADAVISRRVFLPAELPGVPPMLPAASTVPVSLRLSLSVSGDLPMAGYRALVFYP